ncbi:MAG TPA: hypothetical protein VFV92_13325, partial [Candidatus Bathyarchaeia archaeon]|nr:hypothetical protein [Candidatus Bathyarchaeia archaeon]
LFVVKHKGPLPIAWLACRSGGLDVVQIVSIRKPENLSKRNQRPLPWSQQPDEADGLGISESSGLPRLWLHGVHFG